MTIVGNDSRESDFGILLRPINPVEAVWIALGESQEIHHTASRHACACIDSHANERASGVVESRTELELSVREVIADGNRHGEEWRASSEALDVVTLDIDDEEFRAARWR
jgi:hypothetical protein